jgi:hypothetical protein
MTINVNKNKELQMALLKKISYLHSTYAPSNIIFSLIAAKFDKGSVTKPHLKAQKNFRDTTLTQLEISNDWFTNNIPFWLYAFNKYNLSTQKINILEIGSWEGLSSYFILHALPNATLTCVDTWEGADEHKTGDATTKDVLSNIEISFDKNLSPFSDRL